MFGESPARAQEKASEIRRGIISYVFGVLVVLGLTIIHLTEKICPRQRAVLKAGRPLDCSLIVKRYILLIIDGLVECLDVQAGLFGKIIREPIKIEEINPIYFFSGKTDSTAQRCGRELN